MAGQAIPSDSAMANYELFNRNHMDSRHSLAKAISADENLRSTSTLNEKRNVIKLYVKALRDIQQALSIRIERCPPDKRQKMETDRGSLQKNYELAKGRYDDLNGTLTAVNRGQSSRSPPRQAQNKKAVSSSSTTSTASTASSFMSSNPAPSRVLRDSTSLLRGVNQKYGEEILSTMIKPDGTTMKDIMGNESAKQALEESVVLPTLNPGLFSGLREPCKGILLFGPPGNGKTMLAKAVANESDCAFFNISAAAIMSKWVGDGERLMQALFQVARNAQPSIIFIDEIDSLLNERTEGENGAARRVKTEFLLQVDGCSTKAGDRVLILGATNRPQDLDDGVLRRFPRRIYIDLPDIQSRANLVRYNFRDTNVRLSNRDYDYIAQACENYSFSDMAALCRAAAMFPLKGLSRDELQRIKKDDLRPVTYQDMLEAMKLVRASTNKENVRKLKEFATEFA